MTEPVRAPDGAPPGEGGRIRCAIYVRLSREDGDGAESESIQNQKSLLTAYAAARGWEVQAVYCDEDYSGADSLRPDFNRMLAAAERKEFRILLCKSQSRFTRDMELVEKYIHGLFPLWGIRFIAVADSADTEVRGNKKARQINGLVNEWYLEDLSENVRMVLDMKRREGQYIGGSPLYGYQKDPAGKNRLLIDPEAAEVVRQIFRWSLEGRGRQAIARTLNERGIPGPARYKAEHGGACPAPANGSPGLWSRTAVWRILRNEMYTGVMVQGRRRKVSYKSKVLVDVPADQWYRVEGTHEAIVDRETFDAVQRGLALRARGGGKGEAHLLSGLVRCMDCGGAMSKVTDCRRGRPRRSYLRCRLYADGGRCTRHSIRLDTLESLVSERIRFYVQAWYRLELPALQIRRDGRREALERERRTLAAQLAKRDQALRLLYLDRASGALAEDVFAELSRSFLAEKDRLEQRLARLGRDLANPESPPADLTERARALLKLERVPRELVTALIDRIEIGERDPGTGRQQVRITWKFQPP